MAMSPFRGMQSAYGSSIGSVGGSDPTGGPRMGAAIPRPQTTPWYGIAPRVQQAGSYNLISPAERAVEEGIKRDYAKMLGEQSELYRKQILARQKALEGAASEFSSRYGSQAEMPEEYKMAIAGEAPQMSPIKSYADFAQSRGFTQTPDGGLRYGTGPVRTMSFSRFL